MHIKSLKWLFLLLLLLMPGTIAFANPVLTVKDNGETKINGYTHTKYAITLVADEYSSGAVRKKIYWKDGTQSVWQTVKNIAIFQPGFTYNMTDDVAHFTKSPSCPNANPCVPVDHVEYAFFADNKMADGQQVASKTVSPKVDPAGSGGGTTPPTDPEPGGEDTGGGDGGTDPGSSGGGSCSGCELLACPGWQDLADMFADKIGSQLPPPPDWQEVAEIFGDELTPRFERAMESALEKALGHPSPPPVVGTPSAPSFAESVETPKATDSMPPAQKHDFNTVPDIKVNPDTTGGIDLSKADPTDSIPHDDPDYMPMPGRESGGITPQTKPVETPVPSDIGPTSPSDSIPLPGTSSGSIPVPNSQSDPLPKPELPHKGV